MRLFAKGRKVTAGIVAGLAILSFFYGVSTYFQIKESAASQRLVSTFVLLEDKIRAKKLNETLRIIDHAIHVLGDSSFSLNHATNELWDSSIHGDQAKGDPEDWKPISDEFYLDADYSSATFQNLSTADYAFLNSQLGAVLIEVGLKNARGYLIPQTSGPHLVIRGPEPVGNAMEMGKQVFRSLEDRLAAARNDQRLKGVGR